MCYWVGIVGGLGTLALYYWHPDPGWLMDVCFWTGWSAVVTGTFLLSFIVDHDLVEFDVDGSQDVRLRRGLLEG